MIRYLLSAVIGVALASSSFGQSIFTNPITGTDPGLSNPYTTGQTVNSGITVSGIGRGSGVAGASGNDVYNASGWSSGINPNRFFTWTLTPVSGQMINLTSLTYTSQSTGFTTTPNVELRSSLDGFFGEIPGATGTGATISLSNPEYQNLTTAIEFRLYAFGPNTGATFSINDFTFNGTVTPVPEPMTMMAVAAAGVGMVALRRKRRAK